MAARDTFPPSLQADSGSLPIGTEDETRPSGPAPAGSYPYSNRRTSSPEETAPGGYVGRRKRGSVPAGAPERARARRSDPGPVPGVVRRAERPFRASPTGDFDLRPSQVQTPVVNYGVSEGLISPEWLAPGNRIAQYELIRELGHGGMGRVWVARDTRLGRLVAIKLLGLSDPFYRNRFLIEARVTARCQHENIVVIHEVSEYSGTPLMVLEYLSGTSLGEVIRDRIVPAPRAIDYMIPVVRALVCAHQTGLVHRDLKPDNIFVTDSGVVKVLDFGIAKIFFEKLVSDTNSVGQGSLSQAIHETISRGELIGTLAYMSPEQWGMDEVDVRSDIWAVGVILFQLVTGRHPVDPISTALLWEMASRLDEPLPKVQSVRSSVPDRLADLIDRCLEKDKNLRVSTAEQLFQELLALVPAERRTLTQGENPFPGLSAFQEADSGRFFGRDRDIIRATSELDAKPLLAVVGASGVGKSSFVRAGILPALKAQGGEWESLVVRPGRSPLDSLASLLAPLLAETGATSQEALALQHVQLKERLRTEPGYLGAALRARARKRGAKYLLFVDQLEELYTLVSDPEVRRAFTRCLSGVADDPSAPLRVVVSIRSDLIDRVAEDPVFQADVTRGLLLLAPPTREGLKRAVIEPPAMVGFRFEDDELVEKMLDELATTAGSLPLLQFTAARLWEQRDNHHKILTLDAYEKVGGIGGALASHADEVLMGLSHELRGLTRSIFQRLVTPEGTRAILDIDEVVELHEDRTEALELVQVLASARLVTVQNGDSPGSQGAATIEVVHESLIGAWPTLKRWLDESEEDAAFVAQLRTVAKQWESRGRAKGLLWRAEALEEAVRFRQRYQGPLAERERAYLDASVHLAERAVRTKRLAVVGTIAFLSLLVAAGAIALLQIRAAERTAVLSAEQAEKEASRAQKAERTVTSQLKTIKAEEAARLFAEEDALRAVRAAGLTRDELEQAYSKVRSQLILLKKKEAERINAVRTASMATDAMSEAKDELATSQKQAREAKEAAHMSRDQLERAYAEKAAALRLAHEAQMEAERSSLLAESAAREARAATAKAQSAKAELEVLLARERERTSQLRQQQQGKIATELR